MQTKITRLLSGFSHKAVLFISLLTFQLSGCEQFFYEAPTDSSKFTSAKLMQDDMVLFSFAHTAYRMAKGIAAFPDGGKAKYVIDNNILASYHLTTGDLSIIRNEKNRDWQSGAGHFTIIMTNGPTALISQGGQYKDSFEYGRRYWMVNVQSGSIEQVPLESELLALGRAPGHMYMIRDDGTLLLISPSIEEKARISHWNRDVSIVPELWVRYANGDYFRIAASRHYERMRGNEVVYWIPQTRQFKSFDLVSRKNRDLVDFKYPPYQDMTVGVSITNKGQHMELGHKSDGVWAYSPIALDVEVLKK